MTKYKNIGDVEIVMNTDTFQETLEKTKKEIKTMLNEELLYTLGKMILTENNTRNDYVSEYLSNGLKLDKESSRKKMWIECQEMYSLVHGEVISRMKQPDIIKLKIK
jgi:hypothetical protein